MNPIIFRFSKLRKWFNLLLSIVAGGYMLSIGIAISVLEISPIGFFIILTIIAIIWAVWFEWSYFIEFGEDELTFTKHKFFTKKLIKIQYADILYIRRPANKAFLEVLTRNRKKFQLYSTIEGGANALITEFQNHLHDNQIQPEIRLSYKKLSLYEKGWIIICFIFFIPLIFTSANKGLSIWSAWESEWPSFISFPGRIDSFWINDQHEIWLSFQKSFSNDRQIVKLMPNKKTTTFVVEDTLVKYPELVLADELGQPWIIQEDVLFHLVDANWKAINLGEYTIAPWRNAPVTIDGEYWVGTYQKDIDKSSLAKLDLNTEIIQYFDLPKDFGDGGFDIYQIQPAGKFPLVMITKEYSPIYFYSFNNRVWKSEAEPLDIEWISSEYSDRAFLEFGGFTVDSTGNLFVILEKDSLPFIGKFDKEANVWKWSSIERDCDLCSNGYDGIVVDQFERVWLRATYAKKREESDKFYAITNHGLDVWQPVWGESASLVVRYTTRNSGYQIGHGTNRLRIDNEGKIWTADERLVWIDSTKPELPKPLPYDFLGYVPLFPFLIIIPLLIFNIVYRLKLQKYDISQPVE